MDANNMLYITIDGDGIGQMVGRAVLSDDEEGLKAVSQRINSAQDFMAGVLRDLGGEVIELGGDELTAKIPHEAVDHIEGMRKDVQHAFGFTITVGIGQKLSEASKSLLVGKTMGKDQIVMFGPDVDAQLKQVSDRVAAGEGTEEDGKLSEAYLEPKGDDMKAPQKNQPQGQEHDHDEDDCEYCREADASEGGDEEGSDEIGDDEVADGDESMEQEENGDQPSDEGLSPESDEEGEADDSEMDHEHDEDDCEYCNAADDGGEGDEEPLNEEIEEGNPASIAPEHAEGGDVETEEAAISGDTDAQDEHTAEGMSQIAQAIESEEGGDDAPAVANIDDTDLAVGDNMDGGTSHPDDYDESSQEAVEPAEGEEEDGSPDFGSVLKDGLDSHAQNIQKEKVSQMVGQALEGFKANKQVLEMAKEQAPDFYQASIQMLKAMIEMAKMLGMSQDDGQSEGQLESDDQGVEQEMAQDPSMGEPKEDPRAAGGAPPKMARQ